MKMKFDKDTLIKQRFWVLLAIVIPCTLVGILTLVTSVAADIAADRKKVLEKLQSIEKVGTAGLYNQNMIDKIAKEAEELKSKESDVWKFAYNPQAVLYRWPVELEQEFQMTNGLHAWEVKVDRSKKDVAEMPEDTPDKNLMHGKVKLTNKDYILVVDRTKKEHKFFRTGKVKVSLADKSEPLPWGYISDGRAGNPPDIVAIQYEKGLYFGDPLTDSQRDRYSKVYHNQVHPLLEIVNPMTSTGQGVVQLRGWPYTKEEYPPVPNRFFHYNPNEWKRDKDFSEEAWIAQEDLWIQEEIYRLIALANDYVSNFESEPGKGKYKEQSFKNPYWELKLSLAGGNKLKVTIKNRLSRRQKLEFPLLVRTTENKNFPPDKVQIPGEPLNPKGMNGDTRTMEITLDNGPTRTGIYAVQQVLTWETAAVRRVDNVNFGKLGEGESESNRTFPEPLKPYRERKDEGGGAPAGGGGPGGPAGGPPAAGGADAAGPLAGKFGGGGNAAAANAGPNGFIRDRYLEVTPQLRRLPVAVALTIEQEHVDRVQSAFNNSRLRFLTTQVLLTRSPGSVRPQVIEGADAPAGAGPIAGAAGGPAGQPQAGSAINEDLETNVEIVIYGIITIYERFPTRAYPLAAPDAK